jgi:hypothetical protein
MSISRQQYQARHEMFALLQDVLSEQSDNRREDIREETLVYSELNLTEFDLQRIIKQVGAKLQLDTESLALAIAGNEEISTVGDVLDILIDEKELG